ncbi:hypothetical protein CEP54_006020 [Fusarium duplospermum]|uniref:Uncharacterized protein n=1 Tax=Fusarium duplospermum TaxID=1325734 RepID=A0A428Q9D9_9HYPO|nr:hypothetical protein CEP54_006020 [Fusarium duplospermum]
MAYFGQDPKMACRPQGRLQRGLVKVLPPDRHLHSPPRKETIVVAPPTDTEETLNQLSDAEFPRLLPRLRTHLKKMGHRMQVEAIPGIPRRGREKKPRHVLEKIRATEEYDLPNFDSMGISREANRSLESFGRIVTLM